MFITKVKKEVGMSTFSLDEDQRQIKESMESFAADELRPISRDCDEKFEIPPEFLEKHGAKSWFR